MTRRCRVCPFASESVSWPCISLVTRFQCAFAALISFGSDSSAGHFGSATTAVFLAAGASVILVFLISCNELTVSALLWSAGTQTLGVAIYNLDDSGSYDLASALSVLVVLMVVVLMLLLELMAARLPKGVVPWRN